MSLPSPRKVSVEVAKDTKSLSPVTTLLHMTFGQLLDHDMDKTANTQAQISKNIALLYLTTFNKYWLIWNNTKGAYIIMLRRHPCCHNFHHCLCTALPAAGLNIEILYLVQILTFAPDICTSNVGSLQPVFLMVAILVFFFRWILLWPFPDYTKLD